MIHEIILKYSSIFPENILENFKSKFNWAFKYVMTRRISISDEFRRTFIVPLADFINHGEDLARFGLFNKQYEKTNCENRPNEYITVSSFLNFSKVLGKECEDFFNYDGDSDSILQTLYRYLRLKE
jgi:hypothetical protein